ncbi:MAG: hypothetical protein JSS99_05250 [Actinobacteria bacterium]|nr:hypothetical protein [Actinomycetota bacterium]
MDHEPEIADLRHGTELLRERIEDVRADWERKRRDPSVPGAPAPADDPEAANGGAVAGDWEGEGPAANDAGQ